MKRLTLLLLLTVLVLVVNQAWAMSSSNYRLDWFAPLTSSGGSANSTNTIGSFSVGQSVIGYSSGSNYTAGLGYWYGVGSLHRILLPLIMK